uniref:Uncharacterized protein n=1 Tax=Medicago truncatula TaxID=3880 RepID=Q2HWC4_MEDTR|nr:hypothetical protein MtrDRAFT_AC147482g42v2 [Medicago truncatula]
MQVPDLNQLLNFADQMKDVGDAVNVSIICSVTHLAKPDCVFYGIAPQGSCPTAIFNFFIPCTRRTDKSISYHCRLKVNN